MAAAPTATPKTDRHKPRKTLTLSPRLYGLLQELARRNKRPTYWEGRIAVCAALVVAGLLTEAEAEEITRDDD